MYHSSQPVNQQKFSSIIFKFLKFQPQNWAQMDMGLGLLVASYSSSF